MMSSNTEGFRGCIEANPRKEGQVSIEDFCFCDVRECNKEMCDLLDCDCPFSDPDDCTQFIKPDGTNMNNLLLQKKFFYLFLDPTILHCKVCSGKDCEDGESAESKPCIMGEKSCFYGRTSGIDFKSKANYIYCNLLQLTGLTL